MNNDKRLIRLLLVGFVLLAISEAYLIITVSFNSVKSPAPSALSRSAIVGSDQPSVSGPIVSTVIKVTSGTVASVGKDSFTVEQSASSAVATTVTVSSNTQIITRGALLDQATQDANNEKFHAYAEELMQDPQKNQYALAHLVAPSPYQTTTLTLPDLKVGDVVTVFGEPQSDGTFAATQVIVAQPVSK
jgi:hypothetical protein